MRRGSGAGEMSGQRKSTRAVDRVLINQQARIGSEILTLETDGSSWQGGSGTTTVGTTLWQAIQQAGLNTVLCELVLVDALPSSTIVFVWYIRLSISAGPRWGIRHRD